MNFLSYHNRLNSPRLQPSDADFINGYQSALTDLLRYLQETTEYNPAKRMIDSVPLLNSISETNATLLEKMNAIKEIILKS